jgi:thiol-disulfide isomerase/thioredoxin
MGVNYKQRKAVIFIGIFLVGFLVIFFAYKTYLRINHKKVVKQQTAVMPAVVLMDLDSTFFTISETSTCMAIIFFNTECEHCQAQAREIDQQATDFTGKLNLIMISTEPLTSIRAFSAQYNLSKYVFNTFGIVMIPHIFLYSQDRKLIHEFKGETSLETLSKYCTDHENGATSNLSFK